MARFRSRSYLREGEMTLTLEGRAIPLKVRRNPRARRLTLTIDTDNEGAVITIPVRVPVEEAVDMARSRADWILSRLDALPPRVAFTDGAIVPHLGAPCLVRHLPHARQAAVLRGGEIYVPGRAEHLPRRLRDWYKAEARHHLSERARDKAATIGHTPRRITLRDPRSRWGSCSVDGRLSFSWRLVMMPEWVLDYVVAHEVAHLEVMNHSPRFWRIVEKLSGQVKEANDWLRRHGAEVHRYG
jgi:predicted metal-dependent hydrolase